MLSRMKEDGAKVCCLPALALTQVLPCAANPTLSLREGGSTSDNCREGSGNAPTCSPDSSFDRLACGNRVPQCRSLRGDRMFENNGFKFNHQKACASLPSGQTRCLTQRRNDGFWRYSANKLGLEQTLTLIEAGIGVRAALAVYERACTEDPERARPQTVEQVIQVLLHLGEVCASLITCPNEALAIDQHRNGNPKDTAVCCANLFITQDDGIIQSQSRYGSSHNWCRIIHGNAEHLQSTGAVLVLPFCKLRHLNEAGSAPCGPEVQ